MTELFDINIVPIPVKIADASVEDQIIVNMAKIIQHLKDTNRYTLEDKKALLYLTGEFITGERKESRERIDPDILNYLFTGWFVHEHLFSKSSH